MRKIILIILILSAIPAYSETKLNGKYTLVKQKDVLYFAQEIFWFDSTGSFKYVEASDIGIGEGKGNYSIVDSKLKLNFVDPDTIMPHVLDDYRLQIEYELKDSVVYKMIVTDYVTDEPLIGAGAFITDVSNESFSKKNSDFLGEVDIYGNLIFSIEKRYIPGKLYIVHLGYYDFSYEIKDTKSRNMELKLTNDKYPFQNFFTSSDTLSYDIQFLSNNSFLLKEKHSNYWQLYNKTGEYNDK